VIDRFVDRLDRLAQVRGIKILVVAGDADETRVEHPDDVGGFVRHDRGAFAVPQQWHGHAPRVLRVDHRVELMVIAHTVDRIAGSLEAVQVVADIGSVFPAVVQHVRMNDGNADSVFETLEPAEDQRAMRPGTGERHVQVVASSRGREPAISGRPGRAVGRDPVAVFRALALETPARTLRVVPLVVPDTVDQQAHERDSVV
jgi:hypothetical protein